MFYFSSFQPIYTLDMESRINKAFGQKYTNPKDSEDFCQKQRLALCFNSEYIFVYWLRRRHYFLRFNF